MVISILMQIDVTYHLSILSQITQVLHKFEGILHFVDGLDVMN